jgi:DNA-binding XRE family transcriptional regulator
VEEPKLNTVIALAKALHVSTDYLIFDENIGLSRETMLIAEKYERADDRAKASINVALEYLREAEVKGEIRTGKSLSSREVRGA